MRFTLTLNGKMEELVREIMDVRGISEQEAMRLIVGDALAARSHGVAPVIPQATPVAFVRSPSLLDGSQGSSSTPPTPNPPYSSLPEHSAPAAEPDAVLPEPEPVKPRLPPGFEEFWLSWPKRRRKNRGTAVKAWEKAQKAKLLPALPEILQAVEALKKTQDWTKDHGQFVPLPASWLNGQGWEDAEAKPAGAQATHAKPAPPRTLDQLRTDAMDSIRQAVAGRLTGAEVRLFNDEIHAAQPDGYPGVVERARAAAEAKEAATKEPFGPVTELRHPDDASVALAKLRTEQKIRAEASVPVPSSWVNLMAAEVAAEPKQLNLVPPNCPLESGMRPCGCDLPRCPECGYTDHDARFENDHHLCAGTIPSWPEAQIIDDPNDQRPLSPAEIERLYETFGAPLDDHRCGGTGFDDRHEANLAEWLGETPYQPTEEPMEKSTHRVEVVPVELLPHPDAEKLSIVKVFDGGYQVCVRTQDWQGVGLGAYIPPDSICPATEAFAFLGDSRRIKVRRMRGELSQGLLVPAPEGASVGDDVASLLGVTHFEPPMSLLSTKGESAPSPQGYHPVYDLESLRRYADCFEEGEPVFVTEKIHGANARFCFDGENFHCGSRTEWKKEADGNAWWRALRECDALQGFLRMHPSVTVYGEVYGQVQDLRYGTERGEIRLAVFDLLDGGRWMGAAEARALWPDLPWVPLIGESVPFDKASILALAEGPSLIPGADHCREGIVVKPLRERTHPSVGRVCLKVVGNGYLMRRES